MISITWSTRSCQVPKWVNLQFTCVRILPLSVVDNSTFSPNRLTSLSTLHILPLGFPLSHFQVARIFMTIHLFLLILYLARLSHLCWPPHCPLHSRAVRVSTTVQRLLKPRSPLDCPACRLSSTHSSVVESAPLLGRTANKAAQLQTGPVVVAGNRCLHEG